MSKCCYPGCYLDEHEEGEHRIGRPDVPWGELRLVHEFAWSRALPSCDLDPGGRVHQPALAFFADMLGFGWALCLDCQRKYSAPVLPARPIEISPVAIAAGQAGVTQPQRRACVLRMPRRKAGVR